jgi:hypothetical protein
MSTGKPDILQASPDQGFTKIDGKVVALKLPMTREDKPIWRNAALQ